MVQTSTLRRVSAVGGLAAALVVGVATTATAADAPPKPDLTKHASDLSGAPSQCNTTLFAVDWGSSCFNSTGDYQWSRDLRADGLTVYAYLQTSYESSPSRLCIAGSKADNGGWCNWDVGEHGCVRVRLVLTDGRSTISQTPPSDWFSASTGHSEPFSNCDQ